MKGKGAGFDRLCVPDRCIISCVSYAEMMAEVRRVDRIWRYSVCGKFHNGQCASVSDSGDLSCESS